MEIRETNELVLLSHGYDRTTIRMRVKKNGLVYNVTAKLDYASTKANTFVWYAGNHRLSQQQQDDLNRLAQQIQADREKRAVSTLINRGPDARSSHG